MPAETPLVTENYGPVSSGERQILHLLGYLRTEQLRQAQQLDHIDEQLHTLTRFIDEHRAPLAKALKFLDNPVGTYLARRKDKTRT